MPSGGEISEGNGLNSGVCCAPSVASATISRIGAFEFKNDDAGAYFFAFFRRRAFAVLFGFAAIGLVNLLIFILFILSIILQNNTIRSGRACGGGEGTD